MKVAHLLASVSRANGGIAESVRRLTQSLHATGQAPVSVYSLADRFTDQDLPAWLPLQPRCFSVAGPRALGYAPELRATLARADADVMHLAGLWMYPSLAHLQCFRQTNQPYVLSPHGMLDPWAVRQSAWKKRLAARLFEREHLQRAACLHALCPSEAEAIRAYGLTNPICILPNGMDLPDLAEPAAPPSWVGQFPAHRRVLLFLGRLHPKKGLRPLLQAWSQLPQQDWQLVIAGWDQGGHRAELEAMARVQPRPDSITFCGPLHGPAKAAAYRAASAFILPSFSEGLPMTILEAWAYARPVLMTAACNLPEGFNSGSALEITTDHAMLAQSLAQFLARDPAALADMGQRGRALVRDQFSWTRIAAGMLEVYQWIGGQGGRPDSVRLS